MKITRTVCNCGRPAQPDKRTCLRCLQRARVHYRENRAHYKRKNAEWRQQNRRKFNTAVRKYYASDKGQAKRKEWWLRSTYGLEVSDFKKLLRKQKGLCAICHIELDKPQVDHDHATNKVRGLLCGNCNKAIGLFREDTEVLQHAIAYLKKHFK